MELRTKLDNASKNENQTIIELNIKITNLNKLLEDSKKEFDDFRKKKEAEITALIAKHESYLIEFRSKIEFEIRK